MCYIACLLVVLFMFLLLPPLFWCVFVQYGKVGEYVEWSLTKLISMHLEPVVNFNFSYCSYRARTDSCKAMQIVDHHRFSFEL